MPIAELLKRTDYRFEIANKEGHEPPGVTSPRIEQIVNPYDAVVREMMKMRVVKGDTWTGSTDFRVQLQSNQIFSQGNTYWLGFQFAIPTLAEGGPPLITLWCNLWELFGKPYEGSPTLQLGLIKEGAENWLRWTMNGTYEFKETFRQKCETAKFHTAVIGFKLDTKANGGFVEMYIDGKQITFEKPAVLGGGTTTKLEYNVWDPGVNTEAPNEHIPQVYVSKEQSFAGTVSEGFSFVYDKFVVAASKAEAEYWTSEGGGGGSEAVKKFGFDGATEALKRDEGRWAPTTGGATGIFLYDNASGTDSPNDPEAEGHMVAIEREGKELSNGSPYWEWTGTYQQLGVPAGATITEVNLNFDWRCDTYSTGAASTVGPAELRDEAGTLLGTFSTSLAYSATSEWATRAGTKIGALSHASTKKIKLRLNGVPKTGNNAAADNRLLLDWCVVTVTYTIAGEEKTSTYLVASWRAVRGLVMR